MSQQPTLPAIWAVLQSVVATASGLTTIWPYQSASQPDLDYCRLSLGAMSTEGYDYVDEQSVPAWVALTVYAAGDHVINDGVRCYVCTTGGTSGNAGGPTGTSTGIADGSCVWSFFSSNAQASLSVGGVRNVPLQIEVWSASLIEETAKATALSIADQIVTKFRLPVARDALAAVGVTPWDMGAANWSPSIVSIGFRGRASVDITCRMPARAYPEFATFIASLTVGVNAGGGITTTVSAP